jgi:alkylation response protein AidB-like acyl-CoA dehydrogenase
LVDPQAGGLEIEAQDTTTGELEYRLKLSGVTVGDSDVLGGRADDGEMLDWLILRATAALCATEVGLASNALKMTAKYTSERKQFDKPIASFQAVAQRAGDAYIDLEALKLSTMQAVWRLSENLPADREVSIAKFWAAEGGHRICYSAQHLHGGIGVDTDYPLHHYYLRSRQIELTLGGTNTHLSALGDRLAEQGPTAR